jgi:serine protease Do
MKIHSISLLGLAVALVMFSASKVSGDSLKSDTPAGPGTKFFSFADIVRKEKPAVVNISTTQKASPGEKFLPENHPPLGDFFGNTLPNEFRGQSLGSGFLIREDGLILTNNHVIEKADKIIVRLSDEREFEAEVIGRDEKTDLALIKITDHRSLPVVRLGDSDRLDVGEWVIAIGNPFGLEQTVTVGIVSAKGRAIGNGPFDDYIQTDASINPGNSGGPLFNISGEVVGINTAINPSGQGIGFAIPINQVKKVLDQLETYGKISRGWLGVMIQELNEELARSFHLKNKDGALISDVFDHSPASKAGLERGDVIVEFDGQKIAQMRMLPPVVAQTPIGKEVKLKTIRNGQERAVTVKIEQMDEKGAKK